MEEDKCGIGRSLSKDKLLGKGAYGKVLLVKFQGKEYALKVTSYDSLALSELDILLSFSHPNLLQAERAIYSTDCPNAVQGDTVGLLMHLAAHDLVKVIDHIQPDYLSWWKQMANGLAFLHQSNYAHFDIKAPNVLVFSRKGIREMVIGDFGLAMYCRHDSVIKRDSESLVTYWYRPIENLRGSIEWSQKTDVWSLGILFFEMLIGKLSEFSFYTWQKQISAIANYPGARFFSKYADIVEHYLVKNLEATLRRVLTQPGGSELVDSFGGFDRLLALFRGMLNPEIKDRWTMKEVMTHLQVKVVGTRVANAYYSGPPPIYPADTDAIIKDMFTQLDRQIENKDAKKYNAAKIYFLELFFHCLNRIPPKNPKPYLLAYARLCKFILISLFGFLSWGDDDIAGDTLEIAHTLLGDRDYETIEIIKLMTRVVFLTRGITITILEFARNPDLIDKVKSFQEYYHQKI